MSLNGKTATTTEVVIENDGFWPRVAVQTFISLFRIPAEYTPDTIVHELRAAVRIVNTDLATTSSMAKQSGLLDVSTVPGLSEDYLDAVYNYARQRLVRVFETLNRKEAADVQGERANEVGDRWLFESARFVDRVNHELMAYAQQRGAAATDMLVSDADGFRVALL